jgi:hypothetical protein
MAFTSAAQIKVHPNNPAYAVAFANLTNIDMQHTISYDSTFTGIVYGWLFEAMLTMLA